MAFTQGLKKVAVVGPLADLGNLGIPSLVGYHLGKSTAKETGATEEKDPPSRGGKAAKFLLIPGYTGYRMGLAAGHKANQDKKKSK